MTEAKETPDEGVEDVALLILEWLAGHGIDALLRIDAERFAARRPAWTFAASGGPLTVGIRADGATAGECLAQALARLRELGVDVPH